MATPLQKVRSGQPLVIQAGDWNTFIDAARQFKKHQDDSLRNPLLLRGDADIVMVKNSSGSDVDRFGVLGIDSILFTPTESLDGFKNGFCLTGITPAASHFGKFVVTAEAIPNGKLGRAYLSGVCPVQIENTGSFADIKATSRTQLLGGAFGAAQVLYREAGAGVKWGIVRLSAREAAMIPVKVYKTGGVAGPVSTWVYTAKSLEDHVLGTGLTPEMRRPASVATTPPADGTTGTGYFDAAGAFHLLEANESC